MNTMAISDQFVSISQLRANAADCLGSLRKGGDKIVLSHNRPLAVLVDPEGYERVGEAADEKDWKTLVDLKKDGVTVDELIQVLRA